jgi:hypothetical protein
MDKCKFLGNFKSFTDYYKIRVLLHALIQQAELLLATIMKALITPL